MKETVDKLKQGRVRDHEDSRNEMLGSKIRQALNQRISYMVVKGDKQITGPTARSIQAGR